MKYEPLIDDELWTWIWNRCPARLEPNDTGYHGRCELKKDHLGQAHALERGMIVVRWDSLIRFETPGEMVSEESV